jgi:hypothetical protein
MQLSEKSSEDLQTLLQQRIRIQLQLRWQGLLPLTAKSPDTGKKNLEEGSEKISRVKTCRAVPIG